MKFLFLMFFLVQAPMTYSYASCDIEEVIDLFEEDYSKSEAKDECKKRVSDSDCSITKIYNLLEDGKSDKSINRRCEEDDEDCDDVTGAEVVGNVAAVVISLGKDPAPASNIQVENTDDFLDGTNDKVYVFSTRSDVAGAEFDDVVKWLSKNQLFSKMIEAGQLP